MSSGWNGFLSVDAPSAAEGAAASSSRTGTIGKRMRASFDRGVHRAPAARTVSSLHRARRPVGRARRGALGWRFVKPRGYAPRPSVGGGDGGFFRQQGGDGHGRQLAMTEPRDEEVRAAMASDAWAAGDAYEAYMGRWSRRLAREFLAWLEP